MTYLKSIPWYIWLFIGLLIGAWAEWTYISSRGVFWSVFERYQILFSGMLALLGAGILWKIHRSDHENKKLGVASALAAELYSNRRLFTALKDGNNIKHLIDSVERGSGTINSIQDTLYISLGHDFGLLPAITTKLVAVAYSDSRSVFESCFVNAKQVLLKWNEPVFEDKKITREEYVKEGFDHVIGTIDMAIVALHKGLSENAPNEVIANSKAFIKKHNIKVDESFFS